MMLRRLRRDDSGQMSVELVIVLPVVIIIALIVVNALTFFSDCASFDRVARNAVRICATSPAYGQDLDQSIEQVSALVENAVTATNEESSVAASKNGLGYTSFTLTLSYYPTLFGLGLRSEVFGVSLPSIDHCVSIVIDPYSPGMLF